MPAQMTQSRSRAGQFGRNAPVAIIGFGAIAQTLVDALCGAGFDGTLVVLVRQSKVAATQVRLDQIVATRCAAAQAVGAIEDICAINPQVVVECAGHGAITQFGTAVLTQGIDLIIASVGALADDVLLEQLKKTARGSGAQIILPAGAIGGIDTLAAAKIAGIDRVIYTGRKPPQAWAGSATEDIVDLNTLTTATVFFEGKARDAAIRFPKNANVAAILALAGLGMDRTEVRLIADPSVTTNTHEYHVTSPVVDFSMVLTGKPSLLNPKTSQSTVYSLARAVLNRSGTVVI